MKRKSYGRDAGLTVRMIFTSGLLGLLYVGFAVALLYFAHLSLAPMLVIIVLIAGVQYWTSDKLALAASGAKIVSREEAPDLHAIAERLCAMADLPTSRTPSRRVAARSTRRSPSRTGCGSGSSRRRSRRCSPTSSRTSRTATC